MDNRHLCRAYIKPLKKTKPVTLIDFLMEEIETVILDSEKKMKAVRYSFDEVDLMHCTGLHAAKSYRGDSEDDRLVFEGDVLSDGYEIWTVRRSETSCGFSAVSSEDYPFSLYHLANGHNRGRATEIVGTIHDGKEGQTHE